MKSFFSEKNLVVVLFVMVLVIFSLAQEDSRKLERINAGATASSINDWVPAHHTISANKPAAPLQTPAAVTE